MPYLILKPRTNTMTPCLLVTAIGSQVPEFASSTLMGELLDSHVNSAVVAVLLLFDRHWRKELMRGQN